MGPDVPHDQLPQVRAVAGPARRHRARATTLLRNNVVRYSVGLLVFTLVVAVGALDREEESVRELVALIGGILGVACSADNVQIARRMRAMLENLRRPRSAHFPHLQPASSAGVAPAVSGLRSRFLDLAQMAG